MQRLHSDPAVCGVRCASKETRIPVSLILDALAGGTRSRISSGVPALKREDVAAALEYGARLAHERILPLALLVKIKLDENVHGDVAAALGAAGHDVTTARQQGLGAARTRGRCSRQGAKDAARDFRSGLRGPRASSHPRTWQDLSS